MEYVTVVEGARRLGISEKTIRRAIHAGKLPARYPHKNRCEIAVSDLEAWRLPPTEPDATARHLAELETRLHQVELQVQQLQQAQRVSPVTHHPRTFAKVEAPALPGDLVSLQEFADLHAVNRNEAAQCWSRGFIAGQRQGTGKRAPIMIGTKGQRDFWAQFHETPGFRACDNCPHSRV